MKLILTKLTLWDVQYRLTLWDVQYHRPLSAPHVAHIEALLQKLGVQEAHVRKLVHGKDYTANLL